MKMSPEHFEKLCSLVRPFDTPENRARAEALGHSPTRYRWDCLWHARATDWVCKELYEYLDDTHIDTALRRAIPIYGKKC